jgi:hypothetical protein
VYDYDAIIESGGRGVTLIKNGTTMVRNSNNSTSNVSVVEYVVVDVPYPRTARGLLIFFLILLILSFYWTEETVSAVLHVAVAGVTGTWYFAGGASMPKNATWRCARRSLTTSFGTCCVAGACTAVARFIHLIPKKVFPIRCGKKCGCLPNCVVLIIGIGVRLVRLFNQYALSHAAIYGDGYFDSARSAYHMLRTFFWPALVNDALTTAVFSIMALCNSAVAAAIVVLILGWSTVMFLGVMFGVGGVQLIIFRLISAGVATLFVCMAEAPEVMYEINHDFYVQLQAAIDDYVADTSMKKPKLPFKKLPRNATEATEMRQRQAQIAAEERASAEKSA